MGTPDFAVDTLVALADHTDLCLVITQPDRKSGRGKKLKSPPVKEKALEMGLEVIQPDVVKGKRFASRIARLEPDVLVTAAFGRILGRSLLLTPGYGCLNVHASLLPAYRGAAPMNWAIIKGEKQTGVSVMKTIEDMDAGPVYMTSAVDIGENETAGELSKRLSALGAQTLIEVLLKIDDIEPQKQDGSLATWAPLLKKSDGIVDWSQPSRSVHCHIRGMHPWPCAQTCWKGDRIKIHAARMEDSDGTVAFPGTVIRQSEEGVTVACGSGAVRITEIQLPGGKRLKSEQFFTGIRFVSGDVLS